MLLLLLLLDALLLLLILKLVIPFILLTALDAGTSEKLLFVLVVYCTLIENHQYGPAGCHRQYFEVRHIVYEYRDRGHE